MHTAYYIYIILVEQVTATSHGSKANKHSILLLFSLIFKLEKEYILRIIYKSYSKLKEQKQEISAEK